MAARASVYTVLTRARVQRKANAVANHEASFLAIYYNNARLSHV